MIQDFEQRYITARRAVIARRYARMNPSQREAVLATEGPLLLLAGAGSGKTTVLINRVDNLLTFGRGSDITDRGWKSLSFSPRSFRMSLMTRLLSSVS